MHCGKDVGDSERYFCHSILRNYLFSFPSFFNLYSGKEFSYRDWFSYLA